MKPGKMKPTLSWVSDFDAQALSKSACVSAELLVPLSEKFELRLFAHQASNYGAFKVSSIEDLDAIESCAPADVLLIEIEDGRETALPAAIDLRGRRACVWFHDYYSRTGSNLVDKLADRFQGIDCALFSSERDLGEARRAENKIPIMQYLPYPASGVVRKRAAAASKKILSCAGLLVEEQMHSLLRAAELCVAEPEIVWCVEPGAEIAAKMFAADYPGARVRFEQKNLARWQELLPDSAAAVHLHTSAFGDPGPYLAHSLLSGTPVIVSDFSAGALLPDSAAIKILPGAKQCAELRRTFDSLLMRPELSKIGREYALETHSSAAIAGELCAVLGRGAV